MWKLLGFHRTEDRFWPDFADIKHDYTQEFYRSCSSFISHVRGPVSFTVSGYQLKIALWEQEQWRFIQTMYREFENGIYRSMGYCKKDITLLLMNWSYVFLALIHRDEIWYSLPHWSNFSFTLAGLELRRCRVVSVSTILRRPYWWLQKTPGIPWLLSRWVRNSFKECGNPRLA